VGPRLLDKYETRRTLRRFQQQRFFNSDECYMHQVWRIARQEVDGSGTSVGVFALCLGPWFSFTMRQRREVCMKRGFVLIVTRMNVVQRSIDDCDQQ
jgi:hypothetical protein